MSDSARLPRGAEPVLVTGCSGFIGSHLVAALMNGDGTAIHGLDLVSPREAASFPFSHLDVRDLEAGRGPGQFPVVVHLAAWAEAVVPFEQVPALMEANVTGTRKVLEVVRPRRFLFASSSAVYGNGPVTGAPPDWSLVCPLGTYGMSKAWAEMICGEWARRTDGVAIRLRLGNVVGEACRGLIPYLVRHALRYPKGDVSARCRGQGRLVRDYVPVSYVSEVMKAALAKEWEPGTDLVLNVGRGLGWTNGDVGRVVKESLEERGYRLNIDWDQPRAQGESEHVVLDVSDTVRELELPVPGEDSLIEAIRRSVGFFLDGESDGS